METKKYTDEQLALLRVPGKNERLFYGKKETASCCCCSRETGDDKNSAHTYETCLESLENSAGTVKYPIEQGIIKILRDDEVLGRNARYQKLYDSIARWYSFFQRIGHWLFLSKEAETERDFLKKLNIVSDNCVLEVSVGTGDNLRAMPEGITFYGLDISLGMLKQCAKKKARYNFPIVLVHGMAEKLPFADNSFDAVFHIGGINFFTDKKQAINEMFRVAKPGAMVIIADATEELAKKGEKIPFTRKFFSNRDEVIVPPLDLIPNSAHDVQIRFVNDNSLYVISFKK
jgi:ubiquinone/menaquinone biosynthesis C-methylase UbiE